MRRMTILYHEVGPALVRPSPNRDGVPGPSDRVAVYEDHWDWLFEPCETPPNSVDEARQFRLSTWATAPINAIDFRSSTDLRQPAIQLAPHRMAYLEFEGDIGQDRGRVHQIATGHYQPLRESQDVLECILMVEESSHLSSDHTYHLVIERSANDWTLQLRNTGPDR